MKTFDEMGISAMYGTYDKTKGIVVKTIELKDAWIVRKPINELVPKGESDD